MMLFFSEYESKSKAAWWYSHGRNSRMYTEKKMIEQGELIMERKTIGSFIAVLRKANGLTQKDLAEKLNVSDKSVSRWERDDGAPDLSLVPVIAEIF
ncbi:MAG: helix-turn-helix transcriptional regulator, partial [Ruthenibacterium sp.]